MFNEVVEISRISSSLPQLLIAPGEACRPELMMMDNSGRRFVLPIFLLWPCLPRDSALNPARSCWHSPAEIANTQKLTNNSRILGGLHEIPSASRPRRGQAHRR